MKKIGIRNRIEVNMSKEELKLKALELALHHCLSLERSNEYPLLVYEVKAVAKEYISFVTGDSN